MKLEQVTQGLYRIDLGMVSAYLLEGEELTLIDTGTPGKADAICEAISQAGQRPEDLRHILLTHLHVDHAGSAAELKRRTGATVHMHPADGELVGRGQGAREMNAAPTLLSWLVTHLVMRNAPSKVAPIQPDQAIEEGQTLGFAGDAQVLHLPGHTAGQVGLLIPREGGVLIAADAAANMGGKLGYPIVVEDLQTTKATLRRLASLTFEAACFGHGKPIRRNASAEFHDRFASI